MAFAGAAIVAHGPEPDPIDLQVIAWVVAHRVGFPAVTAIALAITVLGNGWVATTLILAIGALIYVLGRRGIAGLRRSDALGWLVATTLARVGGVLLKLAFERERPPELNRLIVEPSFSFPSGHAVFAGITFGLLVLLAAHTSLPRPVRLALIVGFATIGLLVAASRVWLTVHYPTDVAAGLAWGLAWAFAAALVRPGTSDSQCVEAGPPPG